DESSAGGDFAGGESTRVADLAEIERMAADQREEAAAASAAAAAFFAEENAPEVQLEADADFYDDIEIGGEDHANDAVAEGGGPPGPSRRVTSHLVGRAVPGPAPAAAPDLDDEHEMTIEAGDADDDQAPAESAMSVEDALADLGDADAVPARAASEDD